MDVDPHDPHHIATSLIKRSIYVEELIPQWECRNNIRCRGFVQPCLCEAS